MFNKEIFKEQMDTLGIYLTFRVVRNKHISPKIERFYNSNKEVADKLLKEKKLDVSIINSLAGVEFEDITRKCLSLYYLGIHNKNMEIFDSLINITDKKLFNFFTGDRPKEKNIVTFFEYCKVHKIYEMLSMSVMPEHIKLVYDVYGTSNFSMIESYRDISDKALLVYLCLRFDIMEEILPHTVDSTLNLPSIRLDTRFGPDLRDDLYKSAQDPKSRLEGILEHPNLEAVFSKSCLKVVKLFCSIKSNTPALDFIKLMDRSYVRELKEYIKQKSVEEEKVVSIINKLSGDKEEFVLLGQHKEHESLVLKSKLNSLRDLTTSLTIYPLKEIELFFGETATDYSFLLENYIITLRDIERFLSIIEDSLDDEEMREHILRGLSVRQFIYLFLYSSAIFKNIDTLREQNRNLTYDLEILRKGLENSSEETLQFELERKVNELTECLNEEKKVSKTLEIELKNKIEKHFNTERANVRKIQELEEEVFELREEVENLNEEVEILTNKTVRNLSVFNTVSTVTVEEMVTSIAKYKILIIGGHINWINKLSRVVPTLEFFSDKFSDSISSREPNFKVDLILIHWKSTSHTVSKWLVSGTVSDKIVVEVEFSTNIIKTINQIYDKIKEKLG